MGLGAQAQIKDNAIKMIGICFSFIGGFSGSRSGSNL
jgi:hypothetical protein